MVTLKLRNVHFYNAYLAVWMEGPLATLGKISRVKSVEKSLNYVMASNPLEDSTVLESIVLSPSEKI